MDNVWVQAGCFNTDGAYGRAGIGYQGVFSHTWSLGGKVYFSEIVEKPVLQTVISAPLRQTKTGEYYLDYVKPNKQFFDNPGKLW